jgi:hypothetical protein
MHAFMISAAISPSSYDPFDDEDMEAGVYVSTSNLVLELTSIAGRKTFQHTPSKPLAAYRDTVHEILKEYRPKIRALIAKVGFQSLLPTWIPKTRSSSPLDTEFREHVKNLAIPAVRGEPSLLLHDLGTEKSVIDQKQAEHVANIFSLHSHTCANHSDSLLLANLYTVECSSTLLAREKLAWDSLDYVRIGDSMLSSSRVQMT